MYVAHLSDGCPNPKEDPLTFGNDLSPEQAPEQDFVIGIIVGDKLVLELRRSRPATSVVCSTVNTDTVITREACSS